MSKVLIVFGSSTGNTEGIAQKLEEIIAAARCAVETGLNMRRADVVKEVVNLFGGKKTKAVTEWIEKCLDLAIAENRIMLTVDDIMTT